MALNRNITFKERVARNVRLYFEPLKWAVNPHKHPYGFVCFWGTTLVGVVLAFNSNLTAAVKPFLMW